MADGCCGGPSGRRLCPSSPAEPGAILLGIVGPEGKIGYLTPQIRIDGEFIEIAAKGRSPEKRFRFAGPCVEGGCTQWTGSRCGVIDAAIEEAETRASAHETSAAMPAGDAPPPKCSIRSQCRWFFQHGRDACAVCPLIITDVGAEGVRR